MSNRRDFLKQSGSACVALAGLGFLSSHLVGCKAPANLAASSYDATAGKISVPLTGFGTKDKIMVEGPNGEYKIFLSKKSETELTALQLKCTHKGHGVSMEDAKLHCNLHGSEFDFEGNVTNGPAKIPLKKFPVTVEAGNAVIAVNA